MMNENLPKWLQAVSTLSDETEIDTKVGELLQDSTTHRVSAYGLAQAAAGEYLKENKDIPGGLVKAIQGLAKADSGYTGLTVHEAYMFDLRSKNANKLS